MEGGVNRQAGRKIRLAPSDLRPQPAVRSRVCACHAHGWLHLIMVGSCVTASSVLAPSDHGDIGLIMVGLYAHVYGWLYMHPCIWLHLIMAGRDIRRLPTKGRQGEQVGRLKRKAG